MELEGGTKVLTDFMLGPLRFYECKQMPFVNTKKSMELLIHKWPFACLVHEIAQVQGAYDLQFQVCAIKALQEVTEYYLACLFNDVKCVPFIQSM